MNPKYCIIDTETTGLDSKLHNIFQISLIIADEKLKKQDELTLKFRPYSKDRIDPIALDKANTSIEELDACELGSKEAFDQLIEFLSRYCNRYDKTDKLYLAAYNASFDTEFLREFFKKHDDEYFGSWFWTPSLCVMQLAAWTLLQGNIRPKMPNFKLGTLCQVAGMDWDENHAHDASYDCNCTLELLKNLKGA